MGGVLKIGAVAYPADAAVGEKLIQSSAYLSDSLVAESLGVDTITAVVRDQTTQPRLLAAEGVLVAAGGQLLAAKAQALPLDERAKYGDELDYSQDGKSLLKIYVESVERIGKDAYQVFGISAIGFLLTSDHYGGVYAGETVAQVIADIVNGIFPYTLDATLGATPTFGWLPKQTRRDALRDVLFACGGQVRKDAAGAVVISGQAAAAPYEIPVDDFYMGGSVTGGNPATGIDLTEHTFMQTATDATVTLFDGESAAAQLLTPKGKTVTGVLVDFGEPMHDLSITNAEILESGANYAVISGSPAAVLTGKAYTHTQRIISRRRASTGIPNIVTSSRCTLVNLMNSELVADRLMAYYGAAKTVTADIVATTQKPGDAVAFVDPFGDAREGYIQDMALTMSGIVAANTTIVSGFIPTASGNYYSHMVELTGAGEWTVPAECKGKIRVVIGQAGDGGEAGENGEDGTAAHSDWESNGWAYYMGDPGTGGAPGKGGLPGKVFVGTIEAKPGQVISFSVGAAGVGGTSETAPTEGGETTFGSLSSANGTRPVAGFMPLLSGIVFGLRGEDGVAGVTPPDETQEPTSLTYKGQTWISGAQGAPYQWNWDEGTYWVARGGLPGGPAVGYNGEDGQDAYHEVPVSMSMRIYGGRGGAGASPDKRAAAETPGSGGHGGHGGGGGGGGGLVREYYNGSASQVSVSMIYGEGGPGGKAGPGGDGAPGFILIYY